MAGVFRFGWLSAVCSAAPKATMSERSAMLLSSSSDIPTPTVMPRLCLTRRPPRRIASQEEGSTPASSQRSLR